MSAGGKNDKSDTVNHKYKLSPATHRQIVYSGEAVTLMSLVYSLSTHRLQGGLFIDLSLFSASTSVPFFSSSLFSPSFPSSNGLIFLEPCSYYLLCIFEVQITLSRIINFQNPMWCNDFIHPVLNLDIFSYLWISLKAVCSLAATIQCLVTLAATFVTEPQPQQPWGLVADEWFNNELCSVGIWKQQKKLHRVWSWQWKSINCNKAQTWWWPSDKSHCLNVCRMKYSKERKTCKLIL